MYEVVEGGILNITVEIINNVTLAQDIDFIVIVEPDVGEFKLCCKTKLLIRLQFFILHFSTFQQTWKFFLLQYLLTLDKVQLCYQ